MDIELSRIGVSIPKELLAKFDDIIYNRGYASRSEGIRASIKHYIQYYEWSCEVEGERIAILTVIYDSEKTSFAEKISTIKRQYSELILSISSNYIDTSKCLENIVLQGNASNIRGFTEAIMAQKGVNFVRFSTTRIADMK
ncbi:nickel-responsive transcriptional regulator NikR [Methanosalsum natronophilum]|uniref:Putative nickel-responsive regulator n=1 Tax=Methanosalsum natronophilum TaxID=768733 RepID=A0A3R8CE81_9EURY|nr:nickel-responsive transcriptional regulator NikR [Methanosalsum natronophilum]MCS3924509.1 CopG family nickel-responsive transcriptional regulator [Methanosalsum natronophilum]RQD92246.1 MAG: nickel-responsive transcriptional regulator NikR [Methanosalsum natronophilum]